MKTKIIIVDSVPICRYGLKHILNVDQDILVCFETNCIANSFDAINKHDPDILITDITIECSQGIEFIKQIKSLCNKISIVIFTTLDEKVYGERVFNAGAKGYISKSSSPETIRNAIRKIINGHFYISDQMTEILLNKQIPQQNKMSDNVTPIHKLSNRELIIFELIAQGFKPNQIAKQLNLSTKTVENYRVNIREKLHLQNASQLLQYAIEWKNSESKVG